VASRRVVNEWRATVNGLEASRVTSGDVREHVRTCTAPLARCVSGAMYVPNPGEGAGMGVGVGVLGRPGCATPRGSGGSSSVLDIEQLGIACVSMWARRKSNVDIARVVELERSHHAYLRPHLSESDMHGQDIRTRSHIPACSPARPVAHPVMCVAKGRRVGMA
jgi:hypothetical protein